MYSFDPTEIQQNSEAVLGLDLTFDQANQLAKYVNLLLKWNSSYNLTSIDQPSEVMTLHLMDSLSLVKNLDAVPTDIKRVLDVGSGGGLPAIPLAVMRPELSVSMVDAVQKKIIFLRQCIAVCRLPNAKAFHARIEKLDEEPFDVITSRAFASLSDMVSLTRNLLKPTGYWLAMKGRYPEDEIQALPDDIEVVKVLPVDIAQGKFERNLLILQKKPNL